jgi:hypothetical protein
MQCAQECPLSKLEYEDFEARFKEMLAHEAFAQVPLLRDIFGNPFQPPTLAPAWLAWNNATIPRLAQEIYDSRAFERLPILADALEEAGCTNADILNHCRQPGPHARGCWVVDLILGKIAEPGARATGVVAPGVSASTPVATLPARQYNASKQSSLHTGRLP